MSALDLSPATAGPVRHKQNRRTRSAPFMRTSSGREACREHPHSLGRSYLHVNQEACQGHGGSARPWSAQLLYRPLTTGETQAAYDIPMTLRKARRTDFRVARGDFSDGTTELEHSD